MFLFKSPVCRLVCDVWRSWSSLSWRDWGWKVHSVSPPLPPSVLLPSLTSKALKLSAMSWNTTTVYDKSLDHKVATMTGVLLWVCHVKKKKKKGKKEIWWSWCVQVLSEWHISWRNESCLQWGPLSGPWPYIWKHCVLLCVSQLPPVVWSYWLKWRRGVCVCIDWA